MGYISTITTQQVSSLPQGVDKTPAGLANSAAQVNEANTAKKLNEDRVEVKPPTAANSPTSDVFNFSYNTDIRRSIIKRLNGKDVIRQIPPDEIIKLYKTFAELDKRSTTEMEG